MVSTNNRVSVMEHECYLVAQDFSKVYPVLNDLMLRNAKNQSSRYGETIELLDFKTTIVNPLKRCVAGYQRDINVFFLLAEAMWIWCGRSDVSFLTIFNSRMGEFSDNGKTFHAPYGHRIRHGNRSSDSLTRDIAGMVGELDQMEKALLLLNENKDTRRAVIEIWNMNYDLSVNSKDIPCNDMLMFKIRDNKLRLTIANRSNDLHWGLPTNIFQFSFIVEIMARILGVEVGVQTHNSQSLHLYLDNPIAKKMQESDDSVSLGNIGFYDAVRPTKMDLGFEGGETIREKILDVDQLFTSVMFNLERKANGVQHDLEFEDMIGQSKYFYYVYKLLSIFVEYKLQLKQNSPSSYDDLRVTSIDKIQKLFVDEGGICEDYTILAINFFLKRTKDVIKRAEIMAKLKGNSLINLLPTNMTIGTL